MSGKCLLASSFVWILACVLGCSPPPPVNSADELSVELPQASTSPQAPIDPPSLTELPSDAATPFDAGDVPPPSETSLTQLTQNAGNASPTKPEDQASDAPAEDLPIDGERTDLWQQWPTPDVALVVTGQQNGYIEPCGCTGLDRQKGGIARRYTLMSQLRGKGWNLLPLDAGNQVRRFGRQAEVKLQQTAKALKAMDYRAVGFGPDDLRLGVGELLAVAAGESPDDTMFVSSNVVLIDESLVPKVKVVEVNGLKFGITSVLDPAELEGQLNTDIKVTPKEPAAMEGLQALEVAEAGLKILMFYGREEVAKKLVQDVPGFHLVIVAGGYGEPTYQPESIEGTKTRMIVTGNKGMYVGLVGIYRDGPLRYARVPLSHEFEDAPEMRQVMKEYQQQLQDIGLQGLGLLPPIPHGSGQQFVGTQKCGECHTSAYEVWKGTPHALATDHIVEPPKERGDIARHFDPECLSCHVTGWNPQDYYPYLSGYLSLPESNHLTGNGCENCHGPGSEHSVAEAEGSNVTEEVRDQLRESMKLPLDKAREKCMTCHDLDNSPDFHEENAFEDVYWPEVEHYGKD